MKKQYIVAVLLCVSIIAPHMLYAATAPITASSVLLFTNAQRYRAGLPNLTANPVLSQIAYTKMQDLFARQYFAHEAPTGEDVSDLANAVGYTYLAVGENLALGDFYSNKHVVDSWMDSPGHKANILSPKYSEIGIAAGRSLHKGRYTWVIVQTFGLPKSACPVLDAELKAKIDVLDKRIKLLGTVIDMRKKLVEEDDISRTEYIKRADSYNIAVTIYNKAVTEQKALVEKYNKGVGSYNDCLDERLTVES
jgi:hypothetical protein